jgi:nucleotide-binding universal stress UspA family protein
MNSEDHVIVCGVDGSPGGQRALEWAVDEALMRGSRLRVVTAWSWDGIEAEGAAMNQTAQRDFAQERQDTAVERALVGHESLQVERVLVNDDASTALCKAAADGELLVLGSHGHGTLHDRMVGSTAERILHHAPCPVVVLPSPRAAETKPRHFWHRRAHQREDSIPSAV